MVLYALVSGASIGYLFLAGILPGLLMGLMLMAVVIVMARRRGFPVEPPVPARELPGLTVQSFPALMMPVVLLGGIYSGYGDADRGRRRRRRLRLPDLDLLYRSVGIGDIYGSLVRGARASASIGMLIAGALVFNYVVTAENIPRRCATSSPPTTSRRSSSC
jgi:C4-dicarboxylate transporter, DctM subunit